MPGRSTLLLMLAVGSLSRPLLGQIDPDDTGAGVKRGLAQESNSGQVGIVTAYVQNRRRTLVVLTVASAPTGRTERARLRRWRSCSLLSGHSTDDFPLARVTHGISRTFVPLPLARLMSGNYIVEVFANAGARRVSCGELKP